MSAAQIDVDRLTAWAQPLLTALANGSSTRAAIQQMSAQLDQVPDSILDIIERYKESLDEHHLTIFTLRRRGLSPTEIAYVMNADVRDIRRAISRILVDLRLQIWP